MCRRDKGAKLLHRAMDAADAKSISIPHCVLASKDEPVDAVQAYADILAAGHGGHVETYSSMVSYINSWYHHKIQNCD